jgi:stage II sporulation protein D (peptidoglycan lytic transglycosylase)
MKTAMRCFSLALALALIAPSVFAEDVSIGVLGLFHSRSVDVSSTGPEPLECRAGQDRRSVRSALRVHLESGELVATRGAFSGGQLFCDNGQAGASEFILSIPQKISRRYSGRLEIRAAGFELLLLVHMDLETAVASIVAAESPPGAPLEALKAQAVAARSFLVAGKGRHRGFDFCDTTHCQFLRAPPPANTPAWQATRSTAGMVLAYQQTVFAAMYSASCGGHTHTLAELGIPVRTYPYFAVVCDYCRRHPQKWAAEISREDVSSLDRSEASRLRLAHKLGWKTVPSNSYSTSSRGEGQPVQLEGLGVGHGVGLCQRGAADMARKGASFFKILAHYYPNTVVRQIQ